MSTLPEKYAVMGNPIAHSKSPVIHATFAQQTGELIQYQAILVRTQVGEFAQAVQTFQDNEGKGLNITVPFKQDAWRLVDHCSVRAQQAEAVNTIWFDAQGRRMGDNTDGVGLIRDLKNNQGFDFKGKRILILGAGGAVRGILAPLLEMNPVQCVIANRTVSKAQTLAIAFKEHGKLSACSYATLSGQLFDLIINGTSASLQGELPPLPQGILASGGWCYDMVYGHNPTSFIQWAFSEGAQHAIDGLGMLVEQAAEAFFLWRKIRPDTATVIQQLRKK